MAGIVIAVLGLPYSGKTCMMAAIAAELSRTKKLPIKLDASNEAAEIHFSKLYNQLNGDKNLFKVEGHKKSDDGGILFTSQEPNAHMMNTFDIIFWEIRYYTLDSISDKARIPGSNELAVQKKLDLCHSYLCVNKDEQNFEILISVMSKNGMHFVDSSISITFELKVRVDTAARIVKIDTHGSQIH